MTHEEAISKAIRLLKLAQSDNPHEAALAAAKAQEIIDRYKLTGLSAESELPGGAKEPEEPIRNFEDPLDYAKSGEGKNLSRWKVSLASVLAKANQSRIYTSQVYDKAFATRTPVIRIVGRPSDVETVRYLYQYLVNEVERLTKVHAKGNGKTWANNFRYGVVDEIRDRLEAQRNETAQKMKKEIEAFGAPDAQVAIVRVNQGLIKLEKQGEDVQTWMDENLDLKKTYARSRSDFGAREAGRQAGKSIQLGGGKGLTSGAKRLGSGQ